MQPKFNSNERMPPIESSPANLEKSITNASEHIVRNGLRTIDENNLISESYSDNPEILKIIKDSENKILTASRNVTKSILQSLRDTPFGGKITVLFTAGFSYFVISNEISKKNYNDKIYNAKNDSEVIVSKVIDKPYANPESDDYDLSKISETSSEKSKKEKISLFVAERIKKLQQDLVYVEESILSYKRSIEYNEDLLQSHYASWISDSLEIKKGYKDDLENAKKKLKFWLNQKKEIQESIAVLGNDNEEVFEEERLKLLEHVKSPEYLKKLQKEFGLSEVEAKKHQDVRIKNLEIAHASFQSAEQLEYDGGYYRIGGTEVVISYEDDKKSIKRAISHELVHESTNAEFGMSKKASYLMKESYIPSKTLNELYGGDDSVQTKYFGRPEERIVRKQILDLEMEELGIKKYEEPFTKAHYDKLMELLKAGKLSSDARDFMMTTKPEYFIRIFDELSFGRIKYRIDGDTFILESFIT